jgi:hypothetical protein
MLALFGTRHKVVAIADVGSGSVGFSIMEMNPHGIPKMLAAERCILPLEERARDQTIAGVIRMLSEAGSRALRNYSEGKAGAHLGPPTETYAIIRAPWTRASSGRAVRQFPEETVITRNLINEVAQEALESTKDLDRENMIESSVIRVELNEYKTATPLGKRAHSLTVVTFQSDCDPAIKNGVTASLEALLPGRTPILKSGARAYLGIVQEKMEHPDTYVIVDMVGEATNVIAVRDGIISHNAVIPEGVRTILRRITDQKGIPEEVSALMRMIVAGSCTGEECDRLNEALARVEPELVRAFGESLGDVMGKRRLPETLILFAHPDMLTWLSHVFSRIDFSQFTIPMHPFTVKILTPDTLKSMMQIDAKVSSDASLIITSSFVNM